MDVDARLEALEAENERLRDEIALLKDNLGQRWVAPIEWRLTGQETKLFGRLLKGGLCSKEALMNACYAYSASIDDEPEIKIVDVFICKVRKKIKPFGFTITTRWGAGYQLEPAMIAKFNEEWGMKP